MCVRPTTASAPALSSGKTDIIAVPFAFNNAIFGFIVP
jgi:hypothetical protein